MIILSMLCLVAFAAAVLNAICAVMFISREEYTRGIAHAVIAISNFVIMVGALIRM